MIHAECSLAELLSIYADLPIGDKRTINRLKKMGINPVPLSTVNAWEHLQDEVAINDLEHPLFAFFRIPGANTVDTESPLGVSVFADAETELRSIDIAFSRKDTEVEDSQHVTFVGQAVIQGAKNKGTKLPRYIKGLGVGVNDADVAAIKEHTPTSFTIRTHALHTYRRLQANKWRNP